MATQLLFTPLMAFKNGVFSAGATVEFYLSGTTTAVTVTDVDGNTIAQPMEANSAGVFPEVYRSGGDALKAVIKDSDGATIDTVDPVAQVGDSGSAASGITFSPVTGNAATDAQTAIANNTAEINKTKAIGALGTNGILARTGTNTYASRTMTAGNGVTITNGSGASGNPTYALNYATQAEAEAGTDTVKPLNALRVKQAIDAAYTLEAEAVTTSGTEFDFTGIPAGVNEINVMLRACSLSGTDDFLIQIGDSGGFETASYTSTGYYNSVASSSTAGFLVNGGGAARVTTALVSLRRAAGNSWMCGFVGQDEAGSQDMHGVGRKQLSAELDRVRFTRTGTDTFDAGWISISYR